MRKAFDSRFSGKEIESATFGEQNVTVKLKNGKSFICKAVTYNGVFSWLDYNARIETLR